MSTDKVPNPIDAPTNSVPAAKPKPQDTSSAASKVEAKPEAAPEPASPPFNLAEDMASIIEQNADILARRTAYHSQLMFGVGAVGADVVNASNTAMVLSNALRNRADMQGEKTLINLGDPQIVQVNDGTLPFKNNAQVAGIFEGLVLDTLARAYSDNPVRLSEARTILNDIFQPANNTMDSITRHLSNLNQVRSLPGPSM